LLTSRLSREFKAPKIKIWSSFADAGWVSPGSTRDLESLIEDCDSRVSRMSFWSVSDIVLLETLKEEIDSIIIMDHVLCIQREKLRV